MRDEVSSSGNVITLDEPSDGSGEKHDEHEHFGRGNV
jgi:hypothetical protein